MPTRTLVAALVTAVLSHAGSAQAASYAEPVDGDLSNDRLAPTTLALGLGSNAVVGGFGNGDLDYLTIHVAPGQELVRFGVDPSSVLGSGLSFVGLQAGAAMTVSPTTAPAGLLGWAHFGAQDFGTDLLDDLGTGPGAIGFVGPLPSGAYTLWIQELEAADGLGFAFALDVVAVPEPATAVLVSAGALALAASRRRPRA